MKKMRDRISIGLGDFILSLRRLFSTMADGSALHRCSPGFECHRWGIRVNGTRFRGDSERRSGIEPEQCFLDDGEHPFRDEAEQFQADSGMEGPFATRRTRRGAFSVVAIWTVVTRRFSAESRFPGS